MNRYLLTVAAREMNRALTGYEALASWFLKKRNYSELSNQASELLHALGEEDLFDDREFEGNGEAIKNLITSLRVVAKGECSTRTMRQAYRKSIDSIPEIRAEIRELLGR